MTRTCRHCERTLAIEAFPLGKPRADGSRHPFVYCCDCLSTAALTGTKLRDGGREAHRRANREQMRRRRVGNAVAAA